MHSFTLCLALLAGGQASYGPLDGLKILKPADTQDHPSTPAPAGAVVLFDGKSTEAFQHRDGKSPIGWKVTPEGFLEVKGGDIVTKEKFSTPMHLHVEFRVPYMPKASGQGRGNSGVYVQGRYEVQVLDSYGLDSKDNDCGGIYGVAKPLVNACKAPTVWQAYDIDFTPPVFEGGKKVKEGVITVKQNGVTIHDQQKITKDNTTAGLGGNPAEGGPILLQDHGNPVQYRNIWVVKKTKAAADGGNAREEKLAGNPGSTVTPAGFLDRGNDEGMIRRVKDRIEDRSQNLLGKLRNRLRGR